MSQVRGNGAGPLARAARALDVGYAGVEAKPGKGVQHAHEVARVLGAAGCMHSVQVAGLLHDIVEDTAWTAADVLARFGGAVAALVAAVTEDEDIRGYRRRKRALREQIAQAGPDAIDIALADKVATLRYAVDHGRRVPQRKLAHYEATLAMTPRAAHPALGAEAAGLLAALTGAPAFAAALD